MKCKRAPTQQINSLQFYQLGRRTGDDLPTVVLTGVVVKDLDRDKIRAAGKEVQVDFEPIPGRDGEVSESRQVDGPVVSDI